VIDAGEEVFVLMHQYGTGKGSGAEVEQRFAQLWTFREGKVVRYRGFRNRADALKAAELSE
jgi:ketosteroid isomerase-like protein